MLIFRGGGDTTMFSVVNLNGPAIAPYPKQSGILHNYYFPVYQTILCSKEEKKEVEKDNKMLTNKYDLFFFNSSEDERAILEAVIKD